MPAPPDGWPPELEPTFSIASRSGGTASVMVARSPTPASTATGRSQKVPLARLAATQARQAASNSRLPYSHSRAAVGHGFGWSRCRGGEPDRSKEPGRGTESGQAQCPRQTQCRTRLAAPSRTLSSHGSGG